jgi:hypothetical protein
MPTCGRDSLALDVMEPVRSEVDAWLVDALTTRTFRKAVFFETREGNCRSMPPLARSFAETAPYWTSVLGPVAETAARFLTKQISTDIRLPTPLTEKNCRAGRSNLRRVAPRTSVPVNTLPAGVANARSCLSVPGVRSARNASPYAARNKSPGWRLQDKKHSPNSAHG